MARRALTKTVIDELPVTGRQHFLWDVNPPGFGVRVSPAGVKSYVYQYRIGGRAGNAVRTTVGRHGELTVEQARKLAHKLAEKVREAVDPVKAKREAIAHEKAVKAAAQDLAFDTYCKMYLERRVEGEGMASRDNIEMVFRLHAVPILKSKPLPEITKRDISAVLDALPATSLALRRSAFAILSKMMNWAVGRGDIAASPLIGMKRPPAAPSRDRVLSDCELVLALRAAGDTAAPFGPFYELLFATGQRREEVAGLSWTELDRDGALWTLPGSRTKNGEPNLVHLNRRAVAAIDRAAASAVAVQAVRDLDRKPRPKERERLFDDVLARVLADLTTGTRKWPARGLVFSGTGATALSGFSRAKARLDADMLKLARDDAGEGVEVELEPWRLHDARRTLATGMQRLGVRFEVTEAILNHTSGASRSGVAAVYQRHDWAPEKRAALDAWADHCELALGGKSKKSNVVAFSKEA